MSYEPAYITKGTHPAGSMWARNPIPRINDSPGDSGSPSDLAQNCQNPADGLGCRQFSPICPEPAGTNASRPWHKIEPASRKSDVEGGCSGDWTSGMLVDFLQVPVGLSAGRYVLGWRWDCEETAQVWASCADINVINP